MSIILTAGWIAWLSLVASLQVWAQTPSPQTPTFDPLMEKFLIAAASAILSLLTGYILFQIKESREPKKQLSYDMEVRRGLLGVEEQIATCVSVSYKGRGRREHHLRSVRHQKQRKFTGQGSIPAI